MIVANFKCDNSQCNQIFEVSKSTTTEDFLSSSKCPYCGSLETHRMWSVVDVDVASGMLGNSKNGYDTNITYHPSEKYGKFKGVKVRSI